MTGSKHSTGDSEVAGTEVDSEGWRTHNRIVHTLTDWQILPASFASVCGLGCGLGTGIGSFFDGRGRRKKNRYQFPNRIRGHKRKRNWPGVSANQSGCVQSDCGFSSLRSRPQFRPPLSRPSSVLILSWITLISDEIGFE